MALTSAELGLEEKRVGGRRTDDDEGPTQDASLTSVIMTTMSINTTTNGRKNITVWEC